MLEKCDACIYKLKLRKSLPSLSASLSTPLYAFFMHKTVCLNWKIKWNKLCIQFKIGKTLIIAASDTLFTVAGVDSYVLSICLTKCIKYDICYIHPLLTHFFFIFFFFYYFAKNIIFAKCTMLCFTSCRILIFYDYEIVIITIPQWWREK